jgi:hypothetical protein
MSKLYLNETAIPVLFGPTLLSIVVKRYSFLTRTPELGAGATAGTPTIPSVRINLGSVDFDE